MSGDQARTPVARFGAFVGSLIAGVWMAAMNGIGAVSYTHLDVYKRQSQNASSDVTTTANSAAQASALSTASTASTSTADASAVGDQNADSCLLYTSRCV